MGGGRAVAEQGFQDVINCTEPSYCQKEHLRGEMGTFRRLPITWVYRGILAKLLIGLQQIKIKTNCLQDKLLYF